MLNTTYIALYITLFCIHANILTGSTACLGHGNKSRTAQPMLVRYFSDRGLKVVKVACGHRHASALVAPADPSSDSDGDSSDSDNEKQ
jgi:Regulator of chromosome condensation (RCC1) repeat